MRGAGPIGYPGSAEVVNMQPPAALIKRGITELPCIGDVMARRACAMLGWRAVISMPLREKSRTESRLTSATSRPHLVSYTQSLLSNG